MFKASSLDVYSTDNAIVRFDGNEGKAQSVQVGELRSMNQKMK